ncbi:MAG: hypothetical protein EPO27_10595 [Betaproteobacteria bacterium]|nr:MAG: hypothetical protein EPO27_10595 [Betaproteobacteria bacterium]
MKEYVAKAVLTLGAGRVRIDVEQAKTRAHNLKPLGEGLHEIVNPIQFKRGERFGWDGEVPKAMREAFGEPAGAAVKRTFGKAVEAARKLV